MEKVVKGLFVALLIAFPIGQVGRIELGGGVNLLLNDVVVFLVVAVWFFQKLSTRKVFQRSELAIPIFLFVAAGILSLAVNVGKFPLPQIGIACLYLVRWTVYAGLFFVVSDFDEIFKKKALYGLLFAGFATAILGFFQYFLYPNLRNLFYAGWDEHLYRLFSTFLDPNFAGGVFVVTFLLAISRIGRDPARLNYLFAGFSAIALLLTYSRGSFISFIVGAGVYLWLTGKKKLIMLLLVVFVIGIYLLPKDLQGEGVKLFRIASISQRLTSMEHAIAIFKDSPLTGVGFNAYRYAQERRGITTVNRWGDIHSAAGTDNSFLFVLATMGIVGGMAYGYLWLRVVRYYWKDPLIIASLIALFIHAIFVNSLFYPHIMEWLWILLGTFKVQKSL